MVSTEIYKVGAPALATAIMKLWIRRNWWAMALGPALCLVTAATVDVKFVYIALMMVFVVLPPVMITVYFYHALSPEARMTVLPHRVVKEAGGLRIIYEGADEDTPPRVDDFIPWSRIRGRRIGGGMIQYRLNYGRYRDRKSVV